MRASDQGQRIALGSPLRLEILGLFTGREPLAIADMARLMGRTAGSLYYHVGILERARLLQSKGTRRAGRRFETLFYPTASRYDLEAEKGGERAALAIKTMSAAFRMAERDFEASIHRSDCVTEGPGRNAVAFRLHLRASPKLLAGINQHLDAIEELVKAEAERNLEPSRDDQHISLTLALLPLKARGKQPTRKGV
jgi:DNA-binding transcriptional ArsR family regulator